jgi:putative hydrolase of HD superfamily
MDAERFAKQRDFLLELDKEKSISRQTHILGLSRPEDDAEHAWHMAVLVYLLAEYADEPFDVGHAMIMALLHDVVEIDAGDTYAYDSAGKATEHDREEVAAKRIYGLLPDDQAAELHELWEEFEADETPEAKMVHLADCLQPMLLNFENHGADWIAHSVSYDQTAYRRAQVADASAELGEYAEDIFARAIANGWVRPAPDGNEPEGDSRE